MQGCWVQDVGCRGEGCRALGAGVQDLGCGDEGCRGAGCGERG